MYNAGNNEARKMFICNYLTRIRSQELRSKIYKGSYGSFTALPGTNGLNYSIFIDRLSRLAFFHLGSTFLLSPFTFHLLFLVLDS